jgi:hypothetical protein
MGVDYDPVLMVGKEFDSPEEAAEFLREHGIDLPDENSAEMEDGLGEYLYGNDLHGLEWQRYNAYSSWDGGWLGWSPSVEEIDKFSNQVNEFRQRWKDLFGEESSLIHAVKIW